MYSGIDDIHLAPAYDMVSTTVYIKNDIPALHLLGSKKWWNEKQLIQFGIQRCDLTKNEVNQCLNECYGSFNTVINDIKVRVSVERNIQKKDVLEKLLDRFTVYSNSYN